MTRRDLKSSNETRFVFPNQKLIEPVFGSGFADVQPMVLPVAWLEESFELDDESANQLVLLEKTFFFGKFIPIVLFLSTLFTAIKNFHSHFKRNKVEITGAEESRPEPDESIQSREQSAKGKKEVKTIS